ncbi:MAG TPA: LytTR family DNA-binding domain-containing protein [Pyrinomonadaceae bacterium]|nr:LytTR family DNA-binding domain-containing protein [Pyrinomonadaceae bacterium]
MKTFIVDDERLARSELKRLLKNFSVIEIIGEAANPDEAIEKIETARPDLLFLDIQMPGRNGFELLESLIYTPRVIFTTAFDEYALKAFEFNALDYLLKPVEQKRLAAAIGKVENHRREEEEKNIRSNSAPLGDTDQIFVKDGERCWFVKLRDVRLLESEGNYTRLYFDKNKPLILRSLNYLEERLDEKFFFRANRKHIINLRWIETIEPGFDGRLDVKLSDAPEIEMSRRQSQKFKELMSL